MIGKHNAIKRVASKVVEFALLLSISAVAQTQPAARGAQDGLWQGHPAPKVAVLYGFANVSDVAMLSEGPVKETCRRAINPSAGRSASATDPLTADEEFELADVVREELTNGLVKKIGVTFSNPPRMPAVGSLVFTGCFVDMEPGSASKRIVGMGLGATHLSAHVRVFYAGASSPVPVAEFDVAVKASQKVPALGAVGLAFKAARQRKETLQNEAKRLANEILARLENDHVFRSALACTVRLNDPFRATADC